MDSDIDQEKGETTPVEMIKNRESVRMAMLNKLTTRKKWKNKWSKIIFYIA